MRDVSQASRGNAIVALSRIFGLHPIVGFGMFALDAMLFGGAMASAGVGWAVTVPVAMAFSIPCILIQRFSFHDTLPTSIGKGLILGLLTAIPTPLPSIVAIGGGVLGTAALLRRPEPSQLPPASDEGDGRGGRR
jgi:hypothetical protein